MTGITRQQAAEAVASLFGTTAVHSRSSRTYDPWEVIDNEGKKWRFVYDSSIHASHRVGRRQQPVSNKTYKVEMNSPKLEYSEMGKLQEVVRALRHAGAVVNESCGMHVHVDASRHTPQSLKNALSIMYSKEDILFKALNVNEERVIRYCKKVRANITLALAISAQAINQSRTVMRKTEISENPAFTFLLRLGLIGPEYKNVREHLLSNLPGRSCRNRRPSIQNTAAKKAAENDNRITAPVGLRVSPQACGGFFILLKRSSS